ncbi:MAG: hypothetical protein IK132_04450 [Clostridia bacterium]|nr:hypothetical protein [Clostridia bacterium]
MKFILLYIRENLRRRKSNYILPFLSFVLSGILLCASVFYLTLSHEEPPEKVYYYPYQIVVRNADAFQEKTSEQAFGGNAYTQFEGRLEYVDLFPAYQKEIEEFDPNHTARRLLLTSIPKGSEHAAFYEEFGYDISSLGDGDVFVSPYVFHYFGNHIENGVLTLTAFQDPSGGPLELHIAGILDRRIADDTEFAFVCSDDALLESLEEQCRSDSSVSYYSFRDDFVHTTENYEKFHESIKAKVNMSIHFRLPTMKEGGIYSGDVGIALFNLFFSVLCIASTLKLKLNREIPDYRKLHRLGMSPAMRFLLPFTDMMLLSIPAYAVSVTAAAALFQRIAPYNAQTYQSGVFVPYFDPSPGVFLLSAFSFFAAAAGTASVLTLLVVLREPEAYKSFVKTSSVFYYNSKSFVLPYIFLRFKRNKAYCLFFIFIVCFPLFVGAMYGTAAANIVSNGGALYSDAAFLITQNEVSYGYDTVSDIVRDISALDGVEAVYTVEKTNVNYTFTKGETSISAQFERLDGYTRKQLSKYLTDGSLDDVLNDETKIAVIDSGGTVLGETLHCAEMGKDYTVGAILKNVPLNGLPPRFWGNETLMQSLNQAEILPADIHVYLAEDLSEEQYAALCGEIPNMVYDPHARYTNQKDRLQSLDDGGTVSANAATAMNVLICVISILSVFLLHTQHLTNRQGEFTLLERLGTSEGRIRTLAFAESGLFVAVGFLIFTLLYGGYVGAINAAIAATGSYEFSGFRLAWREILVLAAGVIMAVGISGYLGTKKRRNES